jgi:hypothetical protein
VNGNTLICSSVGGRVFEVTPAGETVWEYVEGEMVARAPRYPHGASSVGPGPGHPGGATHGDPSAGPAIRLAPVQPNPLRRDGRIGFELDRRADVTLGVYDVQGRHVARIASGSFDAGWFDVTWDGRDRRGRPVPSGLYVVRLEAGSAVRSLRATVLH